MLEFQSTRPRGARPVAIFTLDQYVEFQSTRPRGARPPSNRVTWGVWRFNPRARVGRDATIGSLSTPFAIVSIHAPAWGATIADGQPGQILEVSIHAPAWGATRLASRPETRRDGFNPRARVGRDSSRRLESRPYASFNPRARVGRDLFGVARVAFR